MHRSNPVRSALFLAALMLVAVDADAQRGRTSSGASSGGSSSGYRSSGGPSRATPSPSISRPSFTPPSRPSYTPPSRPSYTPPSSGSSWRSGGSSYGTRGSYVRPSDSRGTTRYVPSSTGYTTGGSDSTGYRPTTRYVDDASSTPGSTYSGATSSGSSGTRGSDLYGSRGASSPSHSPSGTDTNPLGDADRTPAPTSIGDSDVYDLPRSRTPSFPRAYRPTTYTPETYAPSRTYTPETHHGTGATAAPRGDTRGGDIGPPVRSDEPRDISDIVDRYRGGRGSRGDASDSVLSDIADRNGGGSLRPTPVSGADSPYARGPLRRLTPDRGSRAGDAAAPEAPGDPGDSGIGVPGGRLGTAPPTTGGRNRPGGIAGNVTPKGVRVAGSGGVTPGGGAGGTGGYVSPGGSSGSPVPTITVGTYHDYYHHSHHHAHPTFFYWGWYAWCSPYFVYPWYWGWYYPRYYGPVYYDDGPVVVINRTEVIGEGAVDYGASEFRNDGPSTPDERSSLTTAAERYLHLGDRAFREGRYGDAVHFYAKAVEFSPDEGVLYLVLADALFATGDYHYAAFTIRKALALDPSLLDSVVDKRGFYGNPAEFDRQLVVLEMYVRDHPTDTDARLVLALNYLFGSRANSAADVLESPYSERLRGDDAAALILEAARRPH
jgi:hypothetical protein